MSRSLKFVAIPGGRYEVSQPKPGIPSYEINPLAAPGVPNYVTPDIQATTYLANIPADVQGTPISGGPMDTVVSSVPGSYSVTAPDGLYFISPFTDMSIERILEFGLDPALTGYRKDANVVALTKSTNKLLLGDNDLHSKGQGIDICPEFLTRQSGSDLEVLPALFTRMTSLMEAQGFHRDDLSSLLPITRDSVKITWKYLDNSTGATSDAQVYYHLGITDKEVKSERDSLRAEILRNT